MSAEKVSVSKVIETGTPNEFIGDLTIQYQSDGLVRSLRSLTIPIIFAVDPNQGSPETRPIVQCGAYSDVTDQLMGIGSELMGIGYELTRLNTEIENIRTEENEREEEIRRLIAANSPDTPLEIPINTDTPAPPNQDTEEEEEEEEACLTKCTGSHDGLPVGVRLGGTYSVGTVVQVTKCDKTYSNGEYSVVIVEQKFKCIPKHRVLYLGWRCPTWKRESYHRGEPCNEEKKLFPRGLYTDFKVPRSSRTDFFDKGMERVG